MSTATATTPNNAAARIREICEGFGCPEMARDFIDAGHSAEYVGNYFVDQRINQTTPGGATESARVRLGAEYDANVEMMRHMGIERDDYIQSRLIDEGHASLSMCKGSNVAADGVDAEKAHRIKQTREQLARAKMMLGNRSAGSQADA